MTLGSGEQKNFKMYALYVHTLYTFYLQVSE